jgi:hypothetical protein
MAKAKIKGLDKAIDEIFKDYKNAIRNAAKEATEKAKNDLYANAVSCLVAYYDDYEPTSYDRTYSLIDSFVPYQYIKEDEDDILCVAGVRFDSSRLEGIYYGSKTYSPTDSEWIISNFLAGIHPRTDGNTIVGGGNYEQEKYQGSLIPEKEMQSYIDNYYNIFNRNFKRAISKQILRKTRR